MSLVRTGQFEIVQREHDSAYILCRASGKGSFPIGEVSAADGTIVGIIGGSGNRFHKLSTEEKAIVASMVLELVVLTLVKRLPTTEEQAKADRLYISDMVSF